MSQFESFMAPLHQSLIRPARPNRGNPQSAQMPQMGWLGDQSDMGNDAMRLQMAQNLAVARRQQGAGQSPSSANFMAGGPSPIQKAITSAKGAMLHGVDADDDERKQLEQLQNDPNLSLQDFQRVLMHRQSQPKKQAAAPHNFGGQASQPGAGDISVQGPQGTMTANAPAPQQEDPTVNMINAFKGHVSDDVLMAAQQAVNAGVPVQQVYSHLQTATQQGMHQQGGVDPQQRQVMAAKRKRASDLQKQNSELMKQHFGFAGVNSENDFQGNDPDTNAERQAYHQYHSNQTELEGINGELEKGYDQPLAGPQQGGQQQGGYQVGSMIDTPKGKAKVVGLDHDGHPLVQPLG